MFPGQEQNGASVAEGYCSVGVINPAIIIAWFSGQGHSPLHCLAIAPLKDIITCISWLSKFEIYANDCASVNSTWCKRITELIPSLKQFQLDHTAKRAMLLSVVSSSLDKLRLQLFYNISFYQKYLMRVLFFLLCNFKNLPTNTHSKIIKWSQQSIIFISIWTWFNPCFSFFTLEDIQLGIFQYMSQCYTIVAFIYIYKKSKLKKR